MVLVINGFELCLFLFRMSWFLGLSCRVGGVLVLLVLVGFL